jgi:hypothetical protein
MTGSINQPRAAVWAEVPQKCSFGSERNSSDVDRRGIVGVMTLRAVTCAWCSAEMMVPDPVRGRDGYFVLPRRCRQCAGNNVVEIDGALSIVRQQRRQRRRSNTQKITAIKPLAV